MKQTFAFWQAPYLAWFSKPFYQDVVERWRGLALTYLFVLVAVAWLPNAFRLNRLMENFRTQDLPPILEQVPKLEIINGEIQADVNMPYRIIDPKTNETLVVIDTNASEDDFDRLNTSVLITKTQVISNRSSFSRSFNLSDLEGVSIDKESLGRWMDGGIAWTRTLAYPLLVINSWGYRFFQALIFGVIGLIITNSMHAKLPYAAVVRLSVIALTPVIILRTLFDFFSISIPLWWLLAFAITIVYLYQAIKANQGYSELEEGTEYGA
jgi:Protein of unknown function (DUF1189)